MKQSQKNGAAKNLMVFYGWNCTSVIDLYNKIDDISKANDLINSIRICDPAVGSGHFLFCFCIK